MRKYFAMVLFAALCMAGCGAGSAKNSSPAASEKMPLAAPSVTSASGANIFNPYMNASLPNSRRLSPEGEQMARQLGAKAQSIAAEAAHRAHWREELYPVVYGERNAPHEIIVLLDFASPQSEKTWLAVAEATRSLSPKQVKVVLFGNSRENYGTDLTGFAIWLSYSRPGQAMPWLSHALGRWNAVKAEQKRLRGRSANFNNEYDATADPSDYPILYAYMEKLRPPLASGDELALSKYCYDAGNVNTYQAVQVSTYYGVKALPAVVVDGKPLVQPTAGAIVQALKP